MSLSNRIKAKPHLYMPGDTVSGVVKKYNMFDVSAEELNELIEQYKQVNAPGAIKPGMQGLIPILPRHHEKAFSQ